MAIVNLTFRKVTPFWNLCLVCNARQMSTNRQSKVMAKFLGSVSKKKYYGYQDPKGPSSTSSVVRDSSAPRHTPLRVKVLNKIFMNHITDLLASGNMTNKLFGRGLEVSKVVITSDYSIVNVYWFAPENEDHSELESILNSIASPMRQELGTLQRLGRVPRIQFIKDKHFFRSAEVENLLQTADKGTIEEPEDDDGSLLDESTPLPSMRQDAYGLDRSRILNKIILAKNKSKAPHRALAQSLEDRENYSGSSEIVIENQKEAFSKFFQKQKAMKSKMKKMQYSQQDDEFM